MKLAELQPGAQDLDGSTAVRLTADGLRLGAVFHPDEVQPDVLLLAPLQKEREHQLPCPAAALHLGEKRNGVGIGSVRAALQRKYAAVLFQRPDLSARRVIFGGQDLRVPGALAVQTEAVAQKIVAQLVTSDRARGTAAGLAAQAGSAAVREAPLQLRLQIEFVRIDQHEAEFRLLLLPRSVFKHARADCLHAERVGALLPLRADLHGNAAADVRRVKRAAVLRELRAGDLRVDRVVAAQLQLIAEQAVRELRRAHILAHGIVRRAERAIALAAVAVPAEHQTEIGRVGLRLVSGVIRLAVRLLAGLIRGLLSGLRLRRGLLLFGETFGGLRVRLLLRRLLLLELLRSFAICSDLMRKRRGGKRPAVPLAKAQAPDWLDILFPDRVFRLLPLQLQRGKHDRHQQRGRQHRAEQNAEPAHIPKLFHRLLPCKNAV